MAYLRISSATIEFNVGAGGPDPHSFLPSDVAAVMSQSGIGININAFQIIPVRVIAASLTDVTSDEYCYALIGVEVSGSNNNQVRQYKDDGHLAALPCPPFDSAGILS